MASCRKSSGTSKRTISVANLTELTSNSSKGLNGVASVSCWSDLFVSADTKRHLMSTHLEYECYQDFDPNPGHMILHGTHIGRCDRKYDVGKYRANRASSRRIRFHYLSHVRWPYIHGDWTVYYSKKGKQAWYSVCGNYPNAVECDELCALPRRNEASVEHTNDFRLNER